MDDISTLDSQNRSGLKGHAWIAPWVTGLFTDRDRAEQGYQALRARGYEAKDINLVVSDDTRKKYFVTGEV